MVRIQENEIEKGEPKRRDRQDRAEEQESHDWRLTAKTGHLEPFPRCLGLKRFAEVELLDHPPHEDLRFCSQFAPILPFGQARNVLRAHAIALAGYVFHP